MTFKLAITGTLLAGLTLFVWGGLVHLGMPMPAIELKEPKAVDDFVSRQAPMNGVYLDPRGVLVVANLAPDRSTMESRMGSFLAVELATNLAQAFLLLLVSLRLKAGPAMQYAIAGGLIGLASWVAIDASYGDWYGFGIPWLSMALADAVGGGFLAGWVLGWRINAQR